ncbi:MAG: hypothetical protein A3B68_07140 [Candidatus Melainabacteria bacterium RIFCSPHIGHO2_02_FULL_34_12]|nr:MAG: hypothetical protein A3B68_07140 [Candidatus Melainabacteria bacterium RIFCSPHIGHO2_02_FULL_34_12]
MRIHCSGKVLPVYINLVLNPELTFCFKRTCLIADERDEKIGAERTIATRLNMRGVYDVLFSRFKKLSLDTSPNKPEKIHTDVTFDEDSNPDSISIRCSFFEDDAYDSELTEYKINADIEYVNGEIALKNIDFSEHDPLIDQFHSFCHADSFMLKITNAAHQTESAQISEPSHDSMSPTVEKLTQLLGSHTYLTIATLNDTCLRLQEKIAESISNRN